MTVKKCPESGTRRSLKSTLASAHRINSHRGRNQYLKRTLAGNAFFRRPLNASPPPKR